MFQSLPFEVYAVNFSHSLVVSMDCDNDGIGSNNDGHRMEKQIAGQWK